MGETKVKLQVASLVPIYTKRQSLSASINASWNTIVVWYMVLFTTSISASDNASIGASWVVQIGFVRV